MIIYGKKVNLRDFNAADIAKRLFWETEMPDYQLWDAPWETENQSVKEKEEFLKEYKELMQAWSQYYADLPADVLRSTFQIETKDQEYIGWCNSYYLEEEELNINIADKKRAVGIDIAQVEYQSGGLGTEALSLFIDYFLYKGCTELYTQTWSGNYRMIGLAKKLHFVEVFRKKNVRQVRGEFYDGLTYSLDIGQYKHWRTQV